MRRSPSPGAASYRGRERENFQISVKNDQGYKRDSFEDRPVRREERSDARPRGARRPEMTSSRPERPVISSRKDTYREAREQRPVGEAREQRPGVRSSSPPPNRRSEIGGSSRGRSTYRGSSMSAYRPRR